MSQISIDKLTEGSFWVEIKEADTRMLFASPADIVKFLIKKHHIRPFVKRASGNSTDIGPNLIVLSDVLVQNETVSNLTEFPIMHMLYFQGVLVPGHPNYGKRPMIVGRSALLEAQLKYLFVGNYGITDIDELTEAYEGNRAIAENVMTIKHFFADQKFNRYSDLLDTVSFDTTNERVCLRNDIYLNRKSENVFELSYKSSSVTLDLNLPPQKRYGATFTLPRVTIPKARFSVTNTGLGDGWDTERTCFGSLLNFDGKHYMIDVGPHSRLIVEQLGMTWNNISGIFQTHVHDDHFAGYDYFWHSGKKLTVYAMKGIIPSIQRKLSYMFCASESDVLERFNFVGMRYDQWFDLDGLQIRPLNSPHPVETAIYLFRDAKTPDTTYAHFGDLISFDVLDDIFRRNSDTMSQSVIQKFKEDYHISANVKKIDVGGGLIHGKGSDFKDDLSALKVFGHTSRNLSETDLKIGVSLPFGHTHILVP